MSQGPPHQQHPCSHQRRPDRAPPNRGIVVRGGTWLEFFGEYAINARAADAERLGDVRGPHSLNSRTRAPSIEAGASEVYEASLSARGRCRMSAGRPARYQLIGSYPIPLRISLIIKCSATAR